jgi:leucyl aminopeptidase
MTLPLIDASADAVPLHLVTTAEWPAWAAARGEALRELAKAYDFRGQAGRHLLVPATDGHIERVVFGFGDKSNPLLIGQASKDLPSATYRIDSAPPGLDPTLLAIGWALGAYQFDRYKPRRRPAPVLAAPAGADLAEARRVAAAVYLVRDLVNTPANDMDPAALQAAAEKVAQSYGAEAQAIIGEALLAQNFPMIHAVGRAAKGAPRLVHLTWGRIDAPVVALVGKGVTFDSGGLNIKPDAGMRIMKKDMGGAAHALALGQMVMDAKLDVRLHIVLAIVENAIAGDAMRPGDIVPTRKGLQVEIDNTDAEGRLILADALAFASEQKPDLMLDFATLTGAARVALGPELPPLFTDDEALAADYARASAEVFDPLWRLPLWDNYDADMDTAIADLKNTGDSSFAGAIYGGLFLRRFASAKAWAHFDVYAWSPKDRPARPAGGDANALRASYALLKRRFG